MPELLLLRHSKVNNNEHHCEYYEFITGISPTHWSHIKDLLQWILNGARLLFDEWSSLNGYVFIPNHNVETGLRFICITKFLNGPIQDHRFLFTCLVP